MGLYSEINFVIPEEKDLKARNFSHILDFDGWFKP